MLQPTELDGWQRRLRPFLAFIAEWFCFLFAIEVPFFRWTFSDFSIGRNPAIPLFLYFLIVTAIIVVVFSTVFSVPLRTTFGTHFRKPKIKLSVVASLLVLFIIGDYSFLWTATGEMPIFKSIGEIDKFFLKVGRLLVLAAAEEWLFRGYVIGRLLQLMTWKKEVLGLPISTANFVTAALFALSHIGQGPWALFTFFPGLFFGMLREKTGNILLPTVAHTLFNVWHFQF